MKRYTIGIVVIVATIVCAANLSTAQMEKRDFGFFDIERFNTMKPAVGEQAPDFELKTLDGKSIKLSSFRGKPVVVIKGGYT